MTCSADSGLPSSTGMSHSVAEVLVGSNDLKFLAYFQLGSAVSFPDITQRTQSFSISLGYPIK